MSGDTGGIGAPSDPIPPASSVALPPYGLASQAPPGGGLLRMASVHSDLEADKAELERLVKTGGKLAVDRLIPFLQVSLYALPVVRWVTACGGMGGYQCRYEDGLLARWDSEVSKLNTLYHSS